MQRVEKTQKYHKYLSIFLNRSSTCLLMISMPPYISRCIPRNLQTQIIRDKYLTNISALNHIFTKR